MNVPMKMPTTENPESINSNCQSMGKLALNISPVNPIVELIKMISSEVATALFIGIFAKRTKAGTIRNPPPAPTKPVMVPTAIP